MSFLFGKSANNVSFSVPPEFFEPFAPPVTSEEQPSEEEVNALFDTVLADMGLSSDAENHLRLKWSTVEKKWAFILFQKDKNSQQYSPECFIRFMKATYDKSSPAQKLEILQSLSTRLSLDSVSWCVRFIESKGIDILIDLLDKNSRDPQILFELLKSINNSFSK